MPNVAQSVGTCAAAAICHAEARAKRPFSLRRMPASNKLVRGLHIQGTRWRGLLLFLANSPSLRVTAAPRSGRNICLVGPSRGVGFAYLGLRTDPRKEALAYRSGRRVGGQVDPRSLARVRPRSLALTACTRTRTRHSTTLLPGTRASFGTRAAALTRTHWLRPTVACPGAP